MGDAVDRDEEILLDTGHQKGNEPTHMAHIARAPRAIAEARHGLEPVGSDQTRGSHARLNVALVHAFAEAEKVTEVDWRREGGKLEIDREIRASYTRVPPGVNIDLEEVRAKRLV